MSRAAALLAVLIVFVSGIARAEVKLERKLHEGSKQTSHIESATNQVLTLAGMDLETKVTQFLIATSETGKRNGEGELPIVSRIDKLQSEVSLPGGLKISFDSGDPDKKADHPLLEPPTQVLRVTAKSRWTTIFDKKNDVKSVEFDKSLVESVDEMYRSQFDPEQRKKAIAQEIAALPDRPVSKGDSWTRTVETNLGAGQVLTIENRYEYLGTETVDGKSLDKIEFAATSVSYSQDQNTNVPTKVTSSELKVAESAGTILFDREKGATVRLSNKLRIQGSLKISANGMEFPGKLDLTIESKNTLQP